MNEWNQICGLWANQWEVSRRLLRFIKTDEEPFYTLRKAMLSADIPKYSNSWEALGYRLKELEPEFLNQYLREAMDYADQYDTRYKRK